MKSSMIIALSCAMLLSSGCWTAKGVFAPRSGEIFQATRMGPGPVPSVCVAAAVAPLLMSMKYDGAWLALPLTLPALPLGLALGVVDELVVSPTVDLVCLPYDLFQPNHGFYIRFVDDAGNPISGVSVKVHVRRLDAGGLYPLSASDAETMTDENGEVYVSRLFDCEATAWPKKEGFALASRKTYCDVKPSTLKPEADGRLVATCKLVRANAPEGENK